MRQQAVWYRGVNILEELVYQTTQHLIPKDQFLTVITVRTATHKPQDARYEINAHCL